MIRMLLCFWYREDIFRMRVYLPDFRNKRRRVRELFLYLLYFYFYYILFFKVPFVQNNFYIKEASFGVNILGSSCFAYSSSHLPFLSPFSMAHLPKENCYFPLSSGCRDTASTLGCSSGHKIQAWPITVVGMGKTNWANQNALLGLTYGWIPARKTLFFSRINTMKSWHLTIQKGKWTTMFVSSVFLGTNSTPLQRAKESQERFYCGDGDLFVP